MPEPERPIDGTRQAQPRLAPDTLNTTQGTWGGPAAQLPAFPDRIGQFTIKMLLGAGAYGQVYLGFDPVLNRDVAIKLPLRDRLTAESRDRFISEARAAANIHHPNVCPVYAVVAESDPPYLVMHYAAGGTLAGLLDPDYHPPLQLRQKLTIALKLAKGLAAAHAQQVIHRDLKPANVLYDKARREVLITDFGLARIGTQPRGTLEGTIFGTPAYMSPEQARGDVSGIGPSSDVYSLGVILYEMLTGRTPFAGGMYEIMHQHREVLPHPPSIVRPDLDPRLDRLCLKALEKRPADRYSSAKEFGEVLAEYLRRGEPPGSVKVLPEPDPVVFELPPEPEPPPVPAMGKGRPAPPIPPPLPRRSAPPVPAQSELAHRTRRGAYIAVGLVLMLAIGIGTVVLLKQKESVPDADPPREVDSGPSIKNKFAGHKFDQAVERRAAEQVLAFNEDKREAATVALGVSAPDVEAVTVVDNPANLPAAFVVRYIYIGSSDRDIDAKLRAILTGLSGRLDLWFSRISYLSDETLRTIARLPNLTALTLNDAPRVTDAGLAALAGHPAIKRASFMNLNVTTTGLGKVVSSWPALADLSLDKPLVTDELLAALKPVTTLTSLNCACANTGRASRLTRAGMDSLAGMKNLTKLNLSSHPVEDNWLPTLYALKPNLKSIDLTNTKNTDTGRNALRKALGDGCEVKPLPLP